MASYLQDPINIKECYLLYTIYMYNKMASYLQDPINIKECYLLYIIYMYNKMASGLVLWISYRPRPICSWHIYTLE